jgi:2-keto-4-pentenoate hydratase/2-oxohepta-3-ene-1,7-dioic acid hydratase in catechol pathway
MPNDPAGRDRPGDVMELEVTGLGVLRNRIVAPAAN